MRMNDSQIHTRKIVYEAANALDAHVLQGLLDQQNIPSEILGEYLQGGVGELPPMGLVKIVVDDRNYEVARRLIEEWEVRCPAAETDSPPETIKSKRSRRFYWLVAGIAIGCAGSAFYYLSPVSEHGIDNNGDGVIDEKWTYSASGRVVKMELDRNFDGKPDFVFHYNKGIIDNAEGDDDFDCVFETSMHYRWGSLVLAEVDTTGDGYPDLRQHFRHDVLVSTEYVDPRTSAPLRIEYFHLNILLHADVDTDRDGRLDTRYLYSPLGEIIATEPLRP